MRNPARWNVVLMAVLGASPIMASAADQPAAGQPATPQAADQPVAPPATGQPAGSQPADEQVKPGPVGDQLVAPPPTDRQPRPLGAEEQVIEPRIDRRTVKVTHIPSNDFEFGVFSGTYATQNFGTDFVWGGRLGYHITEDFFAEAVYGQTHASDQQFRQILPGGIFPTSKQVLRYYTVNAGWNILPGEVFIWKNTAKVSALYLIAGLGSTELDSQRHLTVDAGTGVRVFLRNWVALQMDFRDHIFTLDVLGKQSTTQNLEFSGGVTFFF